MMIPSFLGAANSLDRNFYKLLQLSNLDWRSSQVVRQGSAKALCVGSIPTSASSLFLADWLPEKRASQCIGAITLLFEDKIN